MTISNEGRGNIYINYEEAVDLSYEILIDCAHIFDYTARKKLLKEESIELSRSILCIPLDWTDKWTCE